MYDGKLTYIVKSILLRFSIYYNLGCYNLCCHPLIYFCEMKQSNDVFEFLLTGLSCLEICGIVGRTEG